MLQIGCLGGYLMSTIFISPYSYSAPDQIAILLLSVLLASPIYFTIGALLAVKKSGLTALDILLAVINIVSGCLMILVRILVSSG